MCYLWVLLDGGIIITLPFDNCNVKGLLGPRMGRQVCERGQEEISPRGSLARCCYIFICEYDRTANST